MSSSGNLWIFGYGSLCWKTEFPFEERRVGYIKGWMRRFWQGSTDHRGVPGMPGRVVTLLPSENEFTWGVAYKISEKDSQSVIEYLDYRERGGYTQAFVDVYLNPTDSQPIIERALIYMATESNVNYLGEATSEEIALQISRSSGPSGRNDEYLFNLAKILESENVLDQHIRELVEAIGKHQK